MRKKLPPLPRSVRGAGGVIKVRLVKLPKCEDGADAWGTWEPSTRTIEIERCALLAHQFRVMYHELMHATLSDAGIVNMLSDEAQELLCDAVATSRFAEAFGR